jgi:hypothetical protein
MSTLTPLIAALNGGELSPNMAGRADLPKYQSGSDTIENMIVKLQGPLERRGGTRFIAELKNSANRAWLARFTFNKAQSYVLEMGDEYMRFFVNRGQLLDGGDPYEIETTYDDDDLTGDEGTFKPRYVQSGDQVFFCVEGQPPAVLSRLGAIDWAWTEFPFEGGPFAEENDTATTMVQNSAGNVGDSKTITASTAVFTAGRVGSLLELRGTGQAGFAYWRAAVAITAGANVYSEGKWYKATNSATTGTVAPTHTEGVISDGAVLWRYMHANRTVYLITAVAGNALSATVTLLTENSGDFITGIGSAVTTWSWGAWSDAEGWPTSICFFKERLVFARGRKIWASCIGDYTNFAARVADNIEPSSAINIDIATGRAEEVQWLAGADELLLGTVGGLMILGPLTDQEPFGPGNAGIRPGPAVGAAPIQPVETATTQALFVDLTHQRLREVTFTGDSQSYQAPDLNRLADHVLKPGVIDITYQQQLESCVVCALENGQMAAVTYDALQEVYAWSRSAIGGTRTAVEAIQTIPYPGTDNRRDDIWLIVKRTVGGSIKRYIEVLELPWVAPARLCGETKVEYQARCRLSLADAYYVDCGLTLDSPIAVTDIDLGEDEVTLTAAGHSLAAGDFVDVDDTGVSQLDGRTFKVASVDSNDFVLGNRNTGLSFSGASYDPWVSGGVIRRERPSVSGLDHLEGETVAILGNGAIQTRRVVDLDGPRGWLPHRDQPGAAAVARPGDHALLEHLRRARRHAPGTS